MINGTQCSEAGKSILVNQQTKNGVNRAAIGPAYLNETERLK